MDDQQIVFACGVVLILIILKNVGIGAPHDISVTADQNKEHNIARNKAPKFPPFFFRSLYGVTSILVRGYFPQF